MCPGQRPSLDAWLALHHVPADGNAWGGAGETLEDAIADFGLAQMAARLGDTAAHQEFLTRSGYWRNLYNEDATPGRGYIQDRMADGSWAQPFDPASSRGFAEGSSAQYTWMVPHDVHGLFDAMGGDAAAVARLDDFFRTPDGGWALTGLGGLHAEMDNEPSIGAPFLYLFARRPDRAQEIVREVLDELWSDRPHGIPGNDDLGQMSSWYVWTAMGLYPAIPGRAELVVGAPLFPAAELHRRGGEVIHIEAPGADSLPYVQGFEVGGEATTRTWLPESFVAGGGTLRFTLSPVPDTAWGRGAEDVPPSFGPGG
jgi:predicted alpha-1,2-mannosidase